MIGTVLGLLGGWKKWLAVGLAFLLLAGWLGIEKLRVANLRAENATLKGVIDVQAERLQRAAADIIEAGRVNRDTVAAFQAERAQCRAGYAELERQIAAARQSTITKEKVHVAAQACSGVPPAGRVLADRVRERQAAAGGGEGTGPGPAERP